MTTVPDRDASAVVRTVGGPAGAALLLVTSLVFVWSRTSGLELSLYHDEIVTVTQYVHGGPESIFFGRYLPNNHPLFSVITWMTWSFAGDSELVFRFWSVVPAVTIGVVFVVWVLRRWGAVPGLAVAVLITTSPLIGSLSVLARGYGLAMLAVGVSVIAGIEGVTRSRRSLLVLSIAGATGAALTLPVLALTATGLVLTLLLVAPDHRRTVLVAAGIAGAVCAIWYAPLVDDLLRTSGQEFGEVLPWHGPVSGPLEHLLFPTFRVLLAGPSSVTMQHPVDPAGARFAWFGVGGFLGAAGMFRIWRGDRRTAMLLIVPVAVTFAGLTLGRFFVEPRFASPLFFPVALVVALGIDGTIMRTRDALRPTVAGAWGAAGVALVIAVLPAFQEMTGRPIEAFAPAGQLVSTLEGPVVTNSQRPTGLRYYIDREVSILTGAELEELLCSAEGPFVFIEHPLLAEPVDTACLRARDAHRSRLLQRDRGEHIDVWEVQAHSANGAS